MVLLDYSSIGMVFQILLLQVDFEVFSWLSRGGLSLQYFYPGCYVIDNGDSYTRLSSGVDQTVRSLSPGILVLVLLPMLVDYFNGYVRARSLGIAAQT
jgi:hypothetical protein